MVHAGRTHTRYTRLLSVTYLQYNRRITADRLQIADKTHLLSDTHTNTHTEKKTQTGGIDNLTGHAVPAPARFDLE